MDVHVDVLVMEFHPDALILGFIPKEFPLVLWKNLAECLDFCVGLETISRCPLSIRRILCDPHRSFRIP